MIICGGGEHFEGIRSDREIAWGTMDGSLKHEALTKTIPKKKKCKMAKWLSEEALQIAKKISERQRRNGKKQINQTNQINIYFCFTDYTRAFDCGSQQTVENT